MQVRERRSEFVVGSWQTTSWSRLGSGHASAVAGQREWEDSLRLKHPGQRPSSAQRPVGHANVVSAA
jgi:hypothetical protein